MENLTLLQQMSVQDVWQLVVKDPAIISANAPLSELLEKVIEDSHTRHVYVVDAHNKLLGSVRMNTIVALLFPLEAMSSSSETGLSLFNYVNLGAKTVSDIMNKKPRIVYPDTSLNDMARILVKERIDELPVVNHENCIVGQINMLEVISAYLAIHKK